MLRTRHPGVGASKGCRCIAPRAKLARRLLIDAALLLREPAAGAMPMAVLGWTLRLKDARLNLAQELANLVGRALMLVQQGADQTLEIRAYRHRDGARRITVESRDKFVQRLDALLYGGVIARIRNILHAAIWMIVHA